MLIVFGRYVPGVRFAINASMGVIEMPYRRPPQMTQAA
jgi:membrane protein DedA with SNARE-associated domain